MAATNRLFSNFNEGTLTNSPGTGGTSFTSANFAALPVVADPDFITLTIDPENSTGLGQEVVIVTAHTSSSTTCTVTRAQEGTTAKNWASGHRWALTPTALSLNAIKTTAEAHGLRHIPGGADPGPNDIQAFAQTSGDNTVNTAFGGGGVQLMTATFVPPASWGTYVLYVTGRMSMIMGTTGQYDVRAWVRIDGNDGTNTSLIDAFGNGSRMPLPVTSSQGSLSGNVAVQLRGSREASTENWTATALHFICMAKRAT